MISDRSALDATSPGGVEALEDHMPTIYSLTEVPPARHAAVSPPPPKPDQSVDLGDFDAIRSTKSKAEPTLDQQQFRAVLDTGLFAQLYATGILSFDSDPAEEKKLFPIDVRVHTDIWHGRYTRVLPILGWSTSTIKWEPIKGQGPLRILDTIKEILVGHAATKAELDAFSTLAASYSAELAADPPRIDRFATFTRVSRAAECAVSQAALDSHKQVSLRSAFVSLETDKVIKPVFTHVFDRKKTTAYGGHQQRVLNWTIYSKKKDWIADAISDPAYQSWMVAVDEP